MNLLMKKARHQYVKFKIAKVKDRRIKCSKDSNDKRLYCDLEVADGTLKQDVPFYGCSVDIDNDNTLHGLLYAPIIGSMVGVLFAEGHYSNPVICFTIPFAFERKNKEKFYDLLEDIDDMVLSHRSGSRVIFKKNGDIFIKNKDDDEIFKYEKSSNDIILNKNLKIKK